MFMVVLVETTVNWNSDILDIVLFCKVTCFSQREFRYTYQYEQETN